jgi:hypothetical protein
MPLLSPIFVNASSILVAGENLLVEPYEDAALSGESIDSRRGSAMVLISLIWNSLETARIPNVLSLLARMSVISIDVWFFST